jgi:RNA polymerase sigma factor (sigma-70 family)
MRGSPPGGGVAERRNGGRSVERTSVQRWRTCERLVAVRDTRAVEQARSPTERIGPEPGTLPPYEPFAAFYSDHYAEMVRLAGAVLRDPHLAEEAAQDAFAALYGRWHKVDDPLSYLRRTLVNRCRDQIRREQSSRRLLGRLRGTTAITTPTASDPMDDAIDRLGPNHRTVIVLRYYLGLSPDEIAQALGRNPSTVRSWLRRALTALREDYQHD